MKKYIVPHFYAVIIIVLIVGLAILSSCKKNGRTAIENQISEQEVSINQNILLSDPCPATPTAIQESKNLLKFLYSLKDSSKLLVGQSNFVQTPVRYTNEAITNTGMAPAIWGSDFSYGVGLDGPTGFRQKMIDSAIVRGNTGAIVVLSYHQVRPDASDSAGFSSVQSTMTDAEFDSLLSPGTAMHTAWAAKWDIIATYLSQLDSAHIPVIFRPYHEMNGGHFWWGKKARYPELFQMTFNYLVSTKGLKNLLFMWNSNRINIYAGAAAPYYPGDSYVDILGTDVYHNDYNMATYNELDSLSANKPIALGEFGVPPSAAILSNQSKYVFAMAWSRPTDYTTWAALDTFYNLSQVYTLDEVSNPLPASSCP